MRKDYKKVDYPNLVGKALDYSKGENWMIRQDNGDKKVDVFYLYPTAVDINCSDNIGEINEFVKSNAYIGYEKSVSCFNEYTNIFAPYYHQFSFSRALKLHEYSLFLKEIYETVIRTDVYAALDYFFEHYNNGRPFILAGLSQGGYCLQIILSEYMKLHPEIYSRMVACYAIGVSFYPDYLNANPHIKMASNECDYNVCISWNTEAPGASMDSMILKENQYCINPLNWKIDDTYASRELNKGSYDLATHYSIPHIVDAKIDLKRKVLISKTASEHGYEIIPSALGFGDKSYHMHEWDFFYENVKENGRKRIDSFFIKEKY